MAIKLINLTKSFHDKKVLSNFSCTFKEKKVTCIMGPSGSGKSTLANILMGLIKPDCGEIIGLSSLKIAAVFQEDRLCEYLDAMTNVKLVSSKLSEKEIKEAFEAIDLNDYNNKTVSKLSGGMKRRVSIVRALLTDSDLLILDEPFKGLDPELKSKVISYVKKNIMNKTVILITHDKSEAEVFSANIINLK